MLIGLMERIIQEMGDIGQIVNAYIVKHGEGCYNACSGANERSAECRMHTSDNDQQIDLNAQVALVTGGGRGIGRAIAVELAKAGAAIAVGARSADQLTETVVLIKNAGGRAIPLTVDVTDQCAVKNAVMATEQQLGPVDLLVNNAADDGQIGPLWDANPDAWWRCVEVNLRGPFLCARAAVPGMIARRRGRIVNVSSGAGLRAWRYTSAYAVSKAALIRLGENLAAETGEHGISVFNIDPGFVRTAMTEAAAASTGDQKWRGGRMRRSLTGEGPLAPIPPQRAAELVLFLASGRADALSGCFISVHDDVAEMARRADEIQRDGLHTLRLRT
jgi:NAD(P)-dependent dehydrogenase (short-subunit alcohol dehydrogenase family)